MIGLHQTLDAHGVSWIKIPWDAEQDWSEFDAVLIRTTWDYVDRRDEFLSTIRNHFRADPPLKSNQYC